LAAPTVESNVMRKGTSGYPVRGDIPVQVSSLVRYRPGEAKLHLDIDRTPKLKGGSIEFFRPLEEGGVIALVRTVREYDKFNNPKTYRDTFAVIFDPAGAIASATELKLPSSADSVTALARLKLGWFLAGYTHDTTSIDLQVFLFDEAGGFIKQVMLPESRQKASRTGSVESSTVFRPTALSTVDGDILLFRGFSNQPIYRFSLTGELKQTIKLQPNGIDFWSPRLLGDDLFVQAAIEPEKLGVGSGIPRYSTRSFALCISSLRPENRKDNSSDDMDGCWHGRLLQRHSFAHRQTWQRIGLGNSDPGTKDDWQWDAKKLISVPRHNPVRL
jgi:hypothetical protein